MNQFCNFHFILLPLYRACWAFLTDNCEFSVKRLPLTPPCLPSACFHWPVILFALTQRDLVKSTALLKRASRALYSASRTGSKRQGGLYSLYATAGSRRRMAEPSVSSQYV